MSAAASLRLLTGFGGGLTALGVGLWLTPVWLGVTAAGMVFIVSTVLSERLWRRLASPGQIRADLEDRVRNDPS